MPAPPVVGREISKDPEIVTSTAGAAVGALVLVGAGEMVGGLVLVGDPVGVGALVLGARDGVGLAVFGSAFIQAPVGCPG